MEDLTAYASGAAAGGRNRKKSHIRKHVAKEDCYIVAHVVNAVKEAAANSVRVHIPCGRSQFKTYNGVLTELYKCLEGIQQYQIFSMDEVSIGVVSCRKESSDEPVEMNLRRKIDGILTTKEKVVKMMSDHVEVLAPPPPNVEKAKRCTITPGHTSPRSSETIHCTQNRVHKITWMPKQPSRHAEITVRLW
ncbi:hypothetical protein F444_15496 [Phytophthora nicotianae P1976]|uniref:Uncharacterized protein n=1 Tax=Phytophthora nicotianae P1976 TaxID=1317066 RepID=A0A080ZLT9_PHYNI|nr:hypothetical protein F444_15496 [Phytophthora nicotianae P1976]